MWFSVPAPAFCGRRHRSESGAVLAARLKAIEDQSRQARFVRLLPRAWRSCEERLCRRTGRARGRVRFAVTGARRAVHSGILRSASPNGSRSAWVLGATRLTTLSEAELRIRAKYRFRGVSRGRDCLKSSKTIQQTSEHSIMLQHFLTLCLQHVPRSARRRVQHWSRAGAGSSVKIRAFASIDRLTLIRKQIRCRLPPLVPEPAADEG
jgi:hypothetical protein